MDLKLIAIGLLVLLVIWQYSAPEQSKATIDKASTATKNAVMSAVDKVSGNNPAPVQTQNCTINITTGMCTNE